MLLVGVLSIVAGVIILFKPSESIATLAVIAGIFLLLDGILELADAILRDTPNRGLVALLHDGPGPICRIPRLMAILWSIENFSRPQISLNPHEGVPCLSQ